MFCTLVADRRPGLGAVPGRRGVVRDRAEVVRAVLGRPCDSELSSVIMSCDPEFSRRCGGFSPRGDSGADMFKSVCGESGKRLCTVAAVGVQQRADGRRRTSVVVGYGLRARHATGMTEKGTTCVAPCRWVSGQQQHQYTQQKPRGCAVQREAEAERGAAWYRYW